MAVLRLVNFMVLKKAPRALPWSTEPAMRAVCSNVVDMKALGSSRWGRATDVHPKAIPKDNDMKVPVNFRGVLMKLCGGVQVLTASGLCEY